MPKQLSAALGSALQAAGWSEDRYFDPTAALEALRAQGLDVVAATRGALMSLGGLAVTLPLGTSERTGEAITETIEFDPVAAAEWDIVGNRLPDWSKRAGERLTPIAAVADQPMIYLIGESGCIYESYGDLLSRVGVDIWDALEARLTQAEAVAL